MDIKKELSCDGVVPTGPCSAWPKQRHDDLVRGSGMSPHQNEVKVGAKDMVKGLARTAGSALRYGKVSAEVREERYSTCKSCPAFIEDSKRCADCGCFLEAKTWVGGDPSILCPQKKWSR